jgi:translation elongation factor EF-G
VQGGLYRAPPGAGNLFRAGRAAGPVANLFGYATVLRSLSKGLATFTMEMSRYARVPERLAEEIIAARRKERRQGIRK